MASPNSLTGFAQPSKRSAAWEFEQDHGVNRLTRNMLKQHLLAVSRVMGIADVGINEPSF
jgi:hypothetical protein